jgi:hypothetical protein
MAAILYLSPIAALAKSGTLPFITTSVTSLSTRSNNKICLEDYALLATLERTPIHAPTGPCLTPVIVCVLTKMQLAAERKATKDLNAKEAADKKLAAATKKAGKQQGLIIRAKARASKAAAKAQNCEDIPTWNLYAVTQHLLTRRNFIFLNSLRGFWRSLEQRSCFFGNFFLFY